MSTSEPSPSHPAAIVPRRNPSTGKVILTHRQRKLLRKKFTRRKAGDLQDSKWVAKFIADGVKCYNSEWERKEEPPSDSVLRMLNRIAERVARTGKFDMRRMDRRFWELLFVCGWNPHGFDHPAWESRWCRMQLEDDRSRKVASIRLRNPEDEMAAAVAAAFADLPLVVSVYEWWISLDAQQRHMILVDSREIYDHEDAFSREKRGNEKSSHM